MHLKAFEFTVLWGLAWFYQFLVYFSVQNCLPACLNFEEWAKVTEERHLLFHFFSTHEKIILVYFRVFWILHSIYLDLFDLYLCPFCFCLFLFTFLCLHSMKIPFLFITLVNQILYSRSFALSQNVTLDFQSQMQNDHWVLLSFDWI